MKVLTNQWNAKLEPSDPHTNGSVSLQRTNVNGVPAPLTDEKLYELCKQYGLRALMWRQKFTGLLPEVFRRKLHQKKGYGSIFEFAARLAGLSEEQVRRVLNLERSFSDKPALKSLLENGEVSVNKLAKIASIATLENQDFLAGQARLLSTRSLETLARDEKYVRNLDAFGHQNGSNQTQIDGESVHVNTHLQGSDGNVKFQQSSEISKNPDTPRAHQITIKDLKILENFSEELKSKLLELQQKGININQLLLEFLNNRELEIAREKEQIAEEMHEKSSAAGERALGVYEKRALWVHEKAAQTNAPETQKPPSRYIPVKIKKLLKKEFGDKCSMPNCQKPAEQIHHTQRFAMSQNHDPRYMAHLCKEHHQIAHSIDIKFHTMRLRSDRSLKIEEIRSQNSLPKRKKQG